MPEGSFAAGPFYGSGTVCLYHPIIGKLHALGPSRFCADGICPCGPSSEGLCGDVGDSLRQALCRRLKCPIPLTRNNRCLVANASPVSTDNALKRWKEEGAWVRDGDFVTFPADFVDDAYQWMRSAEESSEYAYPNPFKELMEALPPLTNPWY